METTAFKRLCEAIDDVVNGNLLLDEIVIFDPETAEAYRIDEGKWIRTNTTNAMRIDHATHGVGQTHAHIYGRKKNVIGVVNLDGTASHNTKMKLSKRDAETLQAHGFTIRADRIVEWIVRPDWTPSLLLG